MLHKDVSTLLDPFGKHVLIQLKMELNSFLVGQELAADSFPEVLGSELGLGEAIISFLILGCFWHLGFTWYPIFWGGTGVNR